MMAPCGPYHLEPIIQSEVSQKEKDNYHILMYIYGKSNMETYITICKIGSQQEFAVWIRKLKQGRYINLEG